MSIKIFLENEMYMLKYKYIYNNFFLFLCFVSLQECKNQNRTPSQAISL